MRCTQLPAMDEYKKKTNTGDDVFIRLHATQSQPRPTAVLFGWLGARHKNLDKYSTIYQSLGYNTVQVVAPASTVFALHPRSHARFLLSMLRILAADKRLTAGGVVFHLFSNGGAFFAPQLSDMFSNAVPDIVKGEDELVVSVCKASFSGLVFDSCPCYLHVPQGSTAIIEGLHIVPPFTYIVTLSFFLLCLFQKLFIINLPEHFWNAVTKARYPCSENYIYSTSDHLLDSEKLDALIEKRKTEGREVTVFRVADAGHVLILRKHPDKYIQIIKSVNEGSVNTWRRDNHLEPWLPDSDTTP